MHFHIITIFPESMGSYIKTSVLGKAQEKGIVFISFYNPRNYTEDNHNTVDDKPYGGGAGMVMMAVPILKAVEEARKYITSLGKTRTKILILSAKGVQYNQKHAVELSSEYDNVILITGRYEGIDERVKIILNADEISVGPYVLTDGELPAMIVVSSIARLIPGAITFESLKEESFFEEVDIYTEYPHYTRPESIKWDGEMYTVPEVLISGNHKHIEEWRNKNSNKGLLK